MKNNSNLFIKLAAIFVFAVSFAATAHAQATRTWVSGTGDDANPCSRLAPCKTFAGTISKTAANGEINTLDPGGFGPVTITKSITIDGGTSGNGAITSAGQTGIIINAGDNGIVILRHLLINGVGTGINGIRILSAKAVYIEDCHIYGFQGSSPTTGRGISDERTTANGTLFVLNTAVERNEQTNIFISPSATGVVAVLDNVKLLDSNANSGLSVRGGSTASIKNSTISANNNFGIVAEADAGGTKVIVENCLITNNGTGVATVTNAPTIYLSNNTISGNNTGVQVYSGSILSFGNNRLVGNGVDGAVSGSAGSQQ
jgi:hypothetical protein